MILTVIQDGEPAVPIRVLLPSLDFYLCDIEEHLSVLNPSEHLIEMYIPAKQRWEIVNDQLTPVVVPAAAMDILISLRPSYMKGFKFKPGLDELLGQRVEPRYGPTLKRPAERQLVSPRETKLPRYFDPPNAVLYTPSKTVAVPPDSEGGMPTFPSQTPLLLPRLPPLPDTPTPPCDLTDVQQEKKRLKFPTHWLASDVLEKTSLYMQQRVGNHGRYSEVFKRVYGIDEFPQTIASVLPGLYPKAYHYFCSLSPNEQKSITWTQLIRWSGIKKQDSTETPFVPFVRPTQPPALPTTQEHVFSPEPLGEVGSQFVEQHGR